MMEQSLAPTEQPATALKQQQLTAPQLIAGLMKDHGRKNIPSKRPYQ